jgi:hypothetical protein
MPESVGAPGASFGLRGGVFAVEESRAFAVS